MRRIIQNTTALAACLSLLAPHAVMAQAQAPQEGAAQEQPAADAPEQIPEATPPCKAGSDCAPAATLTEKAAEAIEAEPAPETAPADQPAQAADTPAPDSTAPTDNAKAPAADDAQKLKEALAEDAEEPAAKTEAPEATAEPTTEAPAPKSPATDAPDEAEAKETQQPDAPADAPEPDATPAEPKQADTKTPEQAEAATPSDKATLEKALTEEQAKPAAKPQQEQAAKQSPAPKPAQQEPAGAQQAPEEGAAKTEAAAEAASNTEAPTAAALNDEAGGEVTEEQVTEDNSRSSDEDFTANLHDALAGTAGQQQAAPKDDSGDKDLTKALLLGLGGIAVGAMLTNKRQVELSTPDRVVVTRQDGSRQVIKDEVALLRQPGSTVSTENFDDGSSRTIVTRADGSKVVTIRDADLRVLRRSLVSADGQSVRLIDDTKAEPVDIAKLPAPAQTGAASVTQLSEQDLRAALLRESQVDRRFTLAQIRDIPQVRSLVAPVDIDAVTFETGSAAIKADQARQLSSLGNVIRDAVAQNPREIFLIEGHTDTVGSDAANLALSDRRAESVALALTEYFDVPPENMVVQGYGEQFLKIRQEGDIRENRRAAVRRITDLMRTAEH